MSKLDHLYVQLINDGWVADRPRLQIQLDGGGAAGQPIRFFAATHIDWPVQPSIRFRYTIHFGLKL